MLFTLFAAAWLHTQQAPGASLKRELNNGTVLWTETIPGSKLTSIQLWISAQGLPETKANHGIRHLVEHLVARGNDGTLDLRLENEGCWLRARTYRDATQFEIDVPPDKLQVGLSALKELTLPVLLEPADLQREVKSVLQEIALSDDVTKLGQGAWQTGYGDAGRDPQGDPEVIKAAKLDDVIAFRDQMFAGGQTALVISGPDDAMAMMKPAYAVMASVPHQRMSAVGNRPSGKPGRLSVEALGEARAALVGPYDQGATIAALCAGLAIASNFDDAFLNYTPSVLPGLVVTGRTDSTGKIGDLLDRSDDATRAGWFAQGKQLANSWIKNQLATPKGNSFMRGLLLCQDSSATPDVMLSAIATLTWQDFVEATKKFDEKNAVLAVGR